MANDLINHPDHYTAGDIECIDAIKSALGSEGFLAYCEGNVIKYIWRHKQKDGENDLRKAQWYLDKILDCYKEKHVNVPTQEIFENFPYSDYLGFVNHLVELYDYDNISAEELKELCFFIVDQIS